MGDARWRTIEHTADLGLEAEAPSLEELFVTAGHGLSGVLVGREEGVGDESGAAAEWRQLALEASDTEALLVDWLRELLHVHNADGLLFAAAEIEELEDGRLVSRTGFRRPEEAASVERELKGVTYHDLEVSRRDGRWFARVVFDL